MALAKVRTDQSYCLELARVALRAFTAHGRMMRMFDLGSEPKLNASVVHLEVRLRTFKTVWSHDHQGQVQTLPPLTPPTNVGWCR